jgi:hypothetical protein
MADIVVRRDGDLPRNVKWRFVDQGDGVYAPQVATPDLPTDPTGNVKTSAFSKTNDLLTQLIVQMKIMNLHLAMITGETIEAVDLVKER